VSPRTRVYLAVVLVALGAAGAVVAGVLLTRTTPGGATRPPAAARLRAGAPPLVLDLGVRDDPEARALRGAARLYVKGSRNAAGRIFGRYGSPQAQVGAALAAWPEKPARRPVSLARLEALAAAHPRSALVQLHLGLALIWVGRTADALAAWRAAARAAPDSASAVRAGDLLHPRSPSGLPIFEPSFSPPKTLAALAPAAQVASLAHSARADGVRAKLLYGVVLQRLGRPISAEREYAAAAALAPRNPDAQVAAAVGRFDKDHPERAFSTLGPLVRVFPHVSTVRFHLGLLLLWIGRIEDAKRELRLAHAEDPPSPLGREAKRLLNRLEGARTK
jgi:tetratricopeptide (TPR) repeat protein